MKSLDEFLQVIVKSGLALAAEAEELKIRTEAMGSGGNAIAAAKDLVKSGRLTKFQAEEILNGRAKLLCFGPYLVQDKLGQGGMGMVLRARHREMNRPVAIKVLPKATRKDTDAGQRFRREVEAASRLMHPNIVTAYDAGEHEGMRYLVMELVQGMDLHSYVQNHGPMRVSDAMHCIIEAARGLEYAHQQGIIHRDIKPANLLLATAAAVSAGNLASNLAGGKNDPALAETKLAPDVAKSRIKVLDMGLARIDEPAVSEVAAGRAKPANAPLTNTGDVMGTADYMSPEQATDTHSVDARTDIYALGCTLCYLLTGHAPYSGETLVKRLLAHRNNPIPSLTGERPDVPQSLDRLFQTMLAKHPEDRTPTMTAVIATLEDCRVEVSPEAQKAAIIRTPPPVRAEQSTSPDKARFDETLRSKKKPAGMARLRKEVPDEEDGFEVGDPYGTAENPAARERRSTRTTRLKPSTKGKHNAPQTIIIQNTGSWMWLLLGFVGIVMVGGLGFLIIRLLNREPEKPVVVIQNESAAQTTFGEPADVIDARNKASERAIAEWAVAAGGRVRILPEKGDAYDVFSSSALPATPFRIESLVIDGAGAVTDAELAQVHRLQTLRELGVARTSVTDQGLESLPGMASLMSLNLQGLNLTDTGLETLGRIPQLNYVVAEGTFTDKGIAQLKPLKRLEHLSLAAHTPTNSSLSTIVAHHPNLVTLLTEHFNLNDDGVGELKKLSDLRILGLADSAITDASVDTIGSMKALTQLIIQGTQISREGLQRLQTMLPNCRIYGGKYDPRRNTVRRILQAGGRVVVSAPGAPTLDVTDFSALPDEFSVLTIDLTGVRQLWLSQLALQDATDVVLRDSGVSPGDVAKLGSYFPLLTSVDLSGTVLDDATCQPLALLKSTRFCDMTRTRVTDNAGKRLQQSLPACEFRWGIPAPTPDRDVALWALAQGAAVSVEGKPGEPWISIADSEALPAADFRIKHLWNIRTSSPDDLDRVGRLTHLENLHFANEHRLSDDGVSRIARCKTLSIIHSGWGDNSGLTDLSLRMLSNQRNLQQLSLANGSFSDAGVMALGKHPETKLLIIGSATSTMSERIGFAILQQFPHVKHLHLYGWIETLNRPALISSIASLKELQLLDTGLLMNDQTIRLLEKHPTLKYLEIGSDLEVRSGFTDIGMRSLPKIPNLLQVNLQNLQITDRGVESLLECPNLEVVKLGGSKITMRSVQKLREKFPEITVTGTPRHFAAENTIRIGGRLVIKDKRGNPQTVESVESIPGETFEVIEQDLTGCTWAKQIEPPEFWAKIPWAFYEAAKIILKDADFLNGQCVISIGKNGSNWTRLEHLDLSNARECSAVQLQSLASIKTLKVLIIKGISLNESSIRQLGQKLPGCRIEWDGGVAGEK